MAVTAADLKGYVNASAVDDAFLTSCLATATAMVVQYVGGAEVPENARDRAVLEVSSELFHRRQAPNGIAQFATPDASPVRVARDPMLGAYPILNRWMGGGFA